MLDYNNYVTSLLPQAVRGILTVCSSSTSPEVLEVPTMVQPYDLSRMLSTISLLDEKILGSDLLLTTVTLTLSLTLLTTSPNKAYKMPLIESGTGAEVRELEEPLQVPIPFCYPQTTVEPDLALRGFPK